MIQALTRIRYCLRVGADRGYQAIFVVNRKAHRQACEMPVAVSRKRTTLAAASALPSWAVGFPASRSTMMLLRTGKTPSGKEAAVYLASKDRSARLISTMNHISAMTSPPFSTI